MLRLDRNPPASLCSPRQFLKKFGSLGVLMRYDSLINLRKTFQHLSDSGVHDVDVVLMLDQWFCGDLASIVAVHLRGGRLIVTAATGQAERTHVGKPPETAAAVGWDSLEFEPDASVAWRIAVGRGRPGRRLMALAPCWLAVST